MIRISPRPGRFSIAAAILVLAAAPARAEPPAPPPPQPTHKHLAGVKYEDFRTETATLEVAAPGGQPTSIDVLGWKWGSLADSTTVYSADPMEGGQIAARKAGGHPHEGRLDATGGGGLNAGRPADGGASEGYGGGLNAGRPADGGASEGYGGGLNAGRPADGGASEGYDGGLNTGRPAAGEPAPAGTLTIRVARGAAVKGQHLPEVKLSLSNHIYALRDVTVSGCTGLGDGTDSCTLSYQSRGD